MSPRPPHPEHETGRGRGESARVGAARHDFSLLTDDDLHLFNEGTHYRLYEKLGSHVVQPGGESGTYFAVWAPDAQAASVMGDFNGWDKAGHPLRPRGRSGIWEGFG